MKPVRELVENERQDDWHQRGGGADRDDAWEWRLEATDRAREHADAPIDWTVTQ